MYCVLSFIQKQGAFAIGSLSQMLVYDVWDAHFELVEVKACINCLAAI